MSTSTPTWTSNNYGNIISGVVVNHYGDVQKIPVDFSGVISGLIQISNSGSTVGDQNGCSVMVFRDFPIPETYPLFELIIPTVSRQITTSSMSLNTGMYVLAVKNLDDVNDIVIGVTTSTLSWPS